MSQANAQVGVRTARPIARPSNKWNHPALNTHEVRRVAVAAVCDPRMIVKYLWGFSQRLLDRERIAVALRQCGHEKLIGTREERQRASQHEAAAAAAKTR